MRLASFPWFVFVVGVGVLGTACSSGGNNSISIDSTGEVPDPTFEAVVQSS